MTPNYLKSGLPDAPGMTPLYTYMKCTSCVGSTEHESIGHLVGTTRMQYRCRLCRRVREMEAPPAKEPEPMPQATVDETAPTEPPPVDGRAVELPPLPGWTWIAPGVARNGDLSLHAAQIEGPRDGRWWWHQAGSGSFCRSAEQAKATPAEAAAAALGYEVLCGDKLPVWRWRNRHMEAGSFGSAELAAIDAMRHAAAHPHAATEGGPALRAGWSPTDRYAPREGYALEHAPRRRVHVWHDTDGWCWTGCGDLSVETREEAMQRAERHAHEAAADRAAEPATPAASKPAIEKPAPRFTLRREPWEQPANQAPAVDKFYGYVLCGEPVADTGQRCTAPSGHPAHVPHHVSPPDPPPRSHGASKTERMKAQFAENDELPAPPAVEALPNSTAALQHELDAARAHIGQVQDLLDKATGDLFAKSDECAKLRAERGRLAGELKQAKAEAQAQIQARMDTARERVKAQEAAADYAHELAKLRQSRDEMHGALKHRGAEVESLGRKLAAAQKALGDLRSQRAHEREWWKTYRAALTGLLAGEIARGSTVAGCEGEAKRQADAAHGPLTPAPQSEALAELRNAAYVALSHMRFLQENGKGSDRTPQYMERIERALAALSGEKKA